MNPSPSDLVNQAFASKVDLPMIRHSGSVCHQEPNKGFTVLNARGMARAKNFPMRQDKLKISSYQNTSRKEGAELPFENRTKSLVSKYSYSIPQKSGAVRKSGLYVAHLDSGAPEH